MHTFYISFVATDLRSISARPHFVYRRQPVIHTLAGEPTDGDGPSAADMALECRLIGCGCGGVVTSGVGASGVCASTTSDEEPLPACELCHRIFTTVFSLRRHSLVVHTLVFRYECETCGFSCDTKTRMRHHKNLHTLRCL